MFLSPYEAIAGANNTGLFPSNCKSSLSGENCWSGLDAASRGCGRERLEYPFQSEFISGDITEIILLRQLIKCDEMGGSVASP